MQAWISPRDSADSAPQSHGGRSAVLRPCASTSWAPLTWTSGVPMRQKTLYTVQQSGAKPREPCKTQSKTLQNLARVRAILANLGTKTQSVGVGNVGAEVRGREDCWGAQVTEGPEAAAVVAVLGPPFRDLWVRWLAEGTTPASDPVQDRAERLAFAQSLLSASGEPLPDAPGVPLPSALPPFFAPLPPLLLVRALLPLPLLFGGRGLFVPTSSVSVCS